MNEREPYGSIVDRFRGTEWAAPEPEPPPPPPRGPRRGAVIALVAIVAIVGSGIAVLSQVAPRIRLPTGGATFVKPGPTPRVPDSIRVLDEYWSFVRSAHLAYHIDITVRVQSTDPKLNASYVVALDVVDDNYVRTINNIGGFGLANVVRLDGVMYARDPGKAWVLGRLTNGEGQMTPFMGLVGRSELVYDHRIDGPPVEHLLVSTDRYAANVDLVFDMGRAGFRPDAVHLDLTVDDAGVPISASYKLTVNASLVDGIPGVEASAEYAFSSFGKTVDIQAPIH